MTFDVPEADATAFADTYQVPLAGKPTVTLEIQGSWDPASAQGDATIFGELGLEAEEYDFEPDGTTGYNGFAIVSRYQIVAGINAAIAYSRAMIDAALTGALDDVGLSKDPIFGLNLPAECPGVPAEVLDPQNTWADRDGYQTKARELVGLFRENFKQFENEVPAEVLAASPQ